MLSNKELFMDINAFAGQSSSMDAVGIFLAGYVVYGFILFEIYLYFVAKRKNEAVFAFYAMLLGLLINQAIGTFYFHNRPFMDHLGTTLQRHIGENSFPSDHTTFMLSIAFTLFLFRQTRVYGAILILLGLASGFARVYIGVHYPYDIIGGTMVGLISAVLVYVFRGRLQILNDYILATEQKILGGKK
jgi:undecaprenyl-diphosphatase